MTTDDLKDLLSDHTYRVLKKAFRASEGTVANWSAGRFLDEHARFLTGLESLGWELRRVKFCGPALDMPDDAAP